MSESNEIEIGSIGNSHAGLTVRVSGGRFFWAIKDCQGTFWEEIPESLYDALVQFNAK